jgi:hypothetical protein
MRRLALLLPVLLAATPGCTADPPRSNAAASAPSVPEVVAHRWDQQRGARVFTDPVAVAGRFVAYTVNRGHLFLTVFDPESGKVESGVTASSASVTPGVDLSVVHDGPRVLFFERPEYSDGPTRLSAYDVRRRRVVWRSRPLEFTSQPASCGRDGRDWCVTGAEGWDGRQGLWRLDARTGGLQMLSAGVGRALGGGLYDEGDWIAGVLGAKVRWRRSAAEIMGGRFDPDHGWAWIRHGRTAVGHFGMIVDLPHRRRWIPYPSSRTAGVDLPSGRTLWTRRGRIGCLPGPLERLVRCETTGRLLVTPGGKVVDRSDVRTAISRLDPSTVELRWKLPAWRWSPSAVADTDWVTLADGRVAARRDRRRYLAIDIADGSVHAVRRDTVGWCEKTVEIRDAGSYLDRRRWTTVHRPCRVDGRAVRLPSYATDEAGARIGDVFAWTDGRGMHAVEVS